MTGRGLIPNRIDISERPAIVARKTRLGDWEGDTVVGAGHKGGLLTLVERKTNCPKSSSCRCATARATQKAAVRRLKPIGNFVHTITFDNGKEFAAHTEFLRPNSGCSERPGMSSSSRITYGSAV